MRTGARERKVFDLIRQGMPDNAITLLTGYSKAVIQAMRKDLERMEQDGKITYNGKHHTCVMDGCV